MHLSAIAFTRRIFSTHLLDAFTIPFTRRIYRCTYPMHLSISALIRRILLHFLDAFTIARPMHLSGIFMSAFTRHMYDGIYPTNTQSHTHPLARMNSG